ncbi:MAG: manganese catalase family protein [Clostridiales bacterium]|nr:manganese catalase family protein [Clostridiales bacterium]
MFVYEKTLQYPVKITNTNPKLAAIIVSQYGGPDGELGASLRYLSQRYSMPFDELKGLLTDIGTEELSHLEMVGTIVHQLTRNLTESQIKTAGFDAYFVDHTAGVYPTAASGFPWSAASMAVKGDLIADLTEDMAAEQKARVTYDNILRLSDDPDVNNVIRYLREREIVHFQRFGEAKRTRWKKKNRAADNMIQPRVIVKNGSWLFSFLGYHILQIERKLSLLVAVFLYDLGTK